jgi:hypothetical protein
MKRFGLASLQVEHLSKGNEFSEAEKFADKWSIAARHIVANAPQRGVEQACAK